MGAYLGLKHSHMLLAYISIIFFNVRFWKYFYTTRPTWVRVAPHIIDTLLIVLGISVAVILRINPFGEGGGWLGLKILFLLGYIGFGVVAMKQRYVLSTRLVAYLMANFMAMAMVYLVIMKPYIF